MLARRRFFALAAAAGLPAVTGCGWEPLYADPQTGPADERLRAIKVMPITERPGQWLENGLRTSFNPGDVPTKQIYTLTVILTYSLASLGIQSQGLGTRGGVQMNASYRLLDTASGKLLNTSTVHVGADFDIQANGYSTVVAEEDAKKRAVEEVRQEIVARITLFMQNRLPNSPAAS